MMNQNESQTSSLSQLLEAHSRFEAYQFLPRLLSFRPDLSTLHRITEVADKVNSLIDRAKELLKSLKEREDRQAVRLQHAGQCYAQISFQVDQCYNCPEMVKIREGLSDGIDKYSSKFLSTLSKMVDSNKQDIKAFGEEQNTQEELAIQAIRDSYRRNVSSLADLLTLLHFLLKELLKQSQNIKGISTPQYKKLLSEVEEGKKELEGLKEKDDKGEEEWCCKGVVFVCVLILLPVTALVMGAIKPDSQLLLKLLPCWAGPTLLLLWLWLHWMAEYVVERYASVLFVRESSTPIEAHTADNLSYKPHLSQKVLFGLTILYLLVMMVTVVADCHSKMPLEIVGAVSVFTSTAMLVWVLLEECCSKGGACKSGKVMLPIVTMQAIQSLLIPLNCLFYSAFFIAEPNHFQNIINELIIMALIVSSLVTILKLYSSLFISASTSPPCCSSSLFFCLLALPLIAGLFFSAIYAHLSPKWALAATGAMYLIRLLLSFLQDKVVLGECFIFKWYCGQTAKQQTYLPPPLSLLTVPLFYIHKLFHPIGYWCILLRGNAFFHTPSVYVILAVGLVLIVSSVARYLTLTDIWLISNTRAGCPFPRLDRVKHPQPLSQNSQQEAQETRIQALEQSLSGFREKEELSFSKYLNSEYEHILQAVGKQMETLEEYIDINKARNVFPQ